MSIRLSLFVALFSFTGVVFSQNKNETSQKQEKSLAVGDSYLGGNVGYILNDGDTGYISGETHGLIVALSIQTHGVKWYKDSYIKTGTTDTALGKGKSNTDTIVRVQGEGNYAAKICYDLDYFSFSDWYLPSKDELNKIHNNRKLLGGFVSEFCYWSSSEYDTKLAYGEYIYWGGQVKADKDSSAVVLCMRSF